MKLHGIYISAIFAKSGGFHFVEEKYLFTLLSYINKNLHLNHNAFDKNFSSGVQKLACAINKNAQKLSNV